MTYKKVVRILSLGMAIALAGWALAGLAQAQSYSVLHTFASTDGANPQAGLVQDAAGNFYGTTFDRGASGYGTVFKMSRSGTVSVLYNFAGAPDAANPSGNLLIDISGNLYGTTIWGGASNLGTVFKLTPVGQETILHSFNGGSDGANPHGGVIRDSAGNFYGTTQYGGTGAGCGGSACGTVFKIDASGNETVLYNFNGDTDSGSVDGANPWGGLVRDSAGNLYGTTVYGGTSGVGTVFKVDTNGAETLLHQFSGASDGAYPYSTLITNSTGNFFGTTYQGGASAVGTVFKLDTSGGLTVLHDFTGGLDGGFPPAGLARDAAGNFYGTTTQGGSANLGTVFKIDSVGNETVVHTFLGERGGFVPEAGLSVDKAGNLYGTTYYGGPKGSSYGTVFRIVP